MGQSRLGHRGWWKMILRPLLAVTAAAFLLSACAVKPKEFGDADRQARAQNDLQTMFLDQEPLLNGLEFHEAIARGLKYNLDKRLKLMERSLAEAGSRNATYDLLPQLAARAGYKGRDSFSSSNSLNTDTGVRTTVFTTSADQRSGAAELALVWNFLDFGLSYVNAQQESERARIAAERRIKVVQNLMVDVRDAYWRAAAAQRLIPRVSRQIKRVDGTIARSKQSIKEGLSDPAKELKVQLALLNHMAKLQDVRRKLSLAKVELAALINLPPGTEYRLKLRKRSLHVPHVKADMFELYELALQNRPELRQEDYEKIIADLEVKKSKLRILPGVEIRVSRNYDSNSFLKESLWASVGGLVTKNLMELVRGPANIKYSKTNVEVANARRRALSMAVITQVHIATIRYGLAKGSFAIKNRTFQTADKLSRVLKNSVDGDDVSPIEALEAESKRTVALIEYYAAYADVQNAYGRILNSMGSHRFPESVERLSVTELTEWLQGKVDSWQPIVSDLEVDGQSYGAPTIVRVQPTTRPSKS